MNLINEKPFLAKDFCKKYMVFFMFYHLGVSNRIDVNSLYVKRIFLLSLFMIFTLWSLKSEVSIIPQPRVVEKGDGYFVFDKDTRWIVENDRDKSLFDDVIERFRVAANYNYSVESGSDDALNSVTLSKNSDLGNEEYHLNIDNNRIVISASGKQGFDYGITSLIQLLPPFIFSDRLVQKEFKVPVLYIEDSPRYQYRGFMLDASRYFMPKENVLKLLDYLSFHKINYFHFHLIDDNGWRLQIEKYPELTDIGAWRVDREGHFPMRHNQLAGEPVTVGGYYCRDDIKEIVDYAAERHIEVIPEIEMPAHTIPSLAAFPHLTCPVVDTDIHVLPGIGGSKASINYCAGNDEVFKFLKNVLDEVFELFPSRYLHIGADEAWREYWDSCPLCSKRMQDNQLADLDELQAYFIKRIDSYLKDNNRRLMAWDEITAGPMPEDAIVFGWRGMGQEAFKAAEMGHSVIMTPARRLYFIRYQGPQWFEPYTYFGNNTLFDVYDYDPENYMESSLHQNVKGIQACLWTEFVGSPQEAEYLIFPRLAALAESAWSTSENKDWDDFLTRLDRLVKVYDYKGINYADKSMFNLFHSVEPKNGELVVDLSSIRNDVEIRYTIDGTEPDSRSKLYLDRFVVSEGMTPRAATFIDGEMMGEILTLNLQFNKATGRHVESNFANADLLTNGLLGSEKITDGEYVDMYNSDGYFIIDFDFVIDFNTLQLSFLNNYGAVTHFPSRVTVSVSDNGDSYSVVDDLKIESQERFSKGIFKRKYDFDLNNFSGRYLKIEIENPGITDEFHARDGQNSRVAIDEIIVN
ncbi:family 20 glycosylhydrolase [Marinilabiliaceae bacterium ANBcel2]|nr:family 20 glycosylhydrolase [Marinilabiliaceae bacterium ANBcel2]